MTTTPMYEAKLNDEGTAWFVLRPDGTVLQDGLTEQEAARLAYGYNVAFGYLRPAGLGEEA